MSEKTEFSRKDLILLSISLTSSVLSPFIVAIIVGTGRFSNFNPDPIQWVGIIAVVIIFIVGIVFLLAKRHTTFRFIKFLISIVNSNWQLFVGLILLVVTLWGIYLTDSFWIILNVIGLTIALFMLHRYFVLLRRNRGVAIESLFVPISIPPGVGNKYFRKFYIDSPSGDVIMGGVKFQFQSQSLVFDTSDTIRDSILRSDGSKEVELKISKPIRYIKSVHVLINSGNSKSFYSTEKVGEIKLVFKEAPPITTELILGKNLREWCIGSPGELVRETSDPLSRVVWQGVNKDGVYAVIDCLEIPLYETIRNKVLEQINFVHKQLQHEDDTYGVHYFVSGITVEITQKQ